MGISQFFPEFYEGQAADADRFSIGSVWWAPVPEVREVPLILDVNRAGPQEHDAVSFEFVDIGSQHFKGRDRLPIHRLSLDKTQELIVSKGKKRPCAILAKAAVSESDVASVAASDGSQGRQAKHLAKPVYLLAPMYSCATFQETGSFGPILTARVKALQYPHLCYFPAFNPSERVRNPGSIMRLDHIFPSFLGRGCDPLGTKIEDAVMEVVLDQLKAVCGMEPSSDFAEIKMLIQDCLPDELR